MRKYSKLSQESTADMTERLGEILSNIEVIKSNSSQNYEQERFAKENHTVFRFIMKQVKNQCTYITFHGDSGFDCYWCGHLT